MTVAEYKVVKEEEKIEKLSTDKIGLEAVEKQVQLMGVKMSRNRLYLKCFFFINSTYVYNQYIVLER